MDVFISKIFQDFCFSSFGTVLIGSLIAAGYSSDKKKKGVAVRKEAVLKIFVITFIIFFLIGFSSSTNMQSSDLLMPFVTSMICFGIMFYVFKRCISTENIKTKSDVLGGPTTVRKIQETKCSCQACGNVWYYGKAEVFENSAQNLSNCGSSMSNCGDSMMCCGGCFPAAYIPPKQIAPVKDLNKCPKCNSSAIRKETVIHEV